MRGNSRAILVVDDEESVRSVISEILSLDGYRVIAAGDAEEALEAEAAEPGPIDLLVTDILMPPGMDGLGLARRVLARRPATKVLYISAYAADDLVQRAVLDGSGDFLPKPFSPLVLQQRVAAMLAPPAGAPGLPGVREPSAAAGEAILLCVRDTLLAGVAKDLLWRAGYEVMEAWRGDEAEFLARWHEGPIHLLLTDWDPAGKALRELLQSLRARRPGLKALFLGDSPSGLPDEGPHGFLPKSFAPGELPGKVRRLLDSSLAG